MRLSRRAVLLIRAADDPVVAALALSLGGCGGQERTRDRIADGFGDLHGRVSRPGLPRLRAAVGSYLFHMSAICFVL